MRVYSAYSPDVPGCGSTGRTKEEVERKFRRLYNFTLKVYARKATLFQNRQPTLHTSMSQRNNPGLSHKTKPAKGKHTHNTKRNLFAELSEGMKSLADGRNGKRTLRTHHVRSR